MLTQNQGSDTNELRTPNLTLLMGPLPILGVILHNGMYGMKMVISH